MKTTVLKTRNLTKKYHHVPAVEGVSLSLEKGDIYGLMDKNGAGKTTLIRLITSLALPDAGEIELWGGNLGGRAEHHAPPHWRHC